MNILHIDSSVQRAQSVSRRLTAAAVAALREAHPGARVCYRDLTRESLPHLTTPLLQVMNGQWDTRIPMNDALRAEAALTELLVTELLAADAIVLGAPMYNFSIPSTLKAWLDRVVRADRTFRYVDHGTQGLALGKRAIVASTRGEPMVGRFYDSTLDHQEAYLKSVLTFIGVSDISVLRDEDSMGKMGGADATRPAPERARPEVSALLAC